MNLDESYLMRDMFKLLLVTWKIENGKLSLKKTATQCGLLRQGTQSHRPLSRGTVLGKSPLHLEPAPASEIGEDQQSG